MPIPTAHRGARHEVSHGALGLNANGSFSYTPTAGYTGPDAFTYKANDGTLDSNTVTVSLTVTPPPGNYGLQLNGTSQYVTFGAAPTLGVTTFTLETWFKRTGAGTGVTTGTNGITSAIPLVTKAAPEGESPNEINANYFLGIDATSGKLVADFEEAAGPNHPVTGNAVVTSNVWHHAAATYDATTGTWNLYLDGVLDQTLVLASAFQPQSASIEHAALGTSLTSTGTAAGFFAGVIDEARIWNVARTAGQIAASRDLELTSGTGLVARWGINEGASTVVADSIGSVTGTATNGPTWVPGFVPPPPPNAAPNAPTLNAPANADTGIGTSPTLNVGVSDPDADTLTVTYFGRPLASGNFVQIAQHTGVASGSSDSDHLARARRRPDLRVVRHGQGPDAHCGHRSHLDLPHRRRAPTRCSWVRVTSPPAASPRTRPRATWSRVSTATSGPPATTSMTTAPPPSSPTAMRPRRGAIPRSSRARGPSRATTTGVPTPPGDQLPGRLLRLLRLGRDRRQWQELLQLRHRGQQLAHRQPRQPVRARPRRLSAGSAQELWLKADLAANSGKNVIALWHKPRYSSGITDYQPVQPLWDDLYAAGVDILLDGHDHIYERTAPMMSGATLASRPGRRSDLRHHPVHRRHRRRGPPRSLRHPAHQPGPQRLDLRHPQAHPARELV